MRPQHFRNFMCVHWECAWCQCQMFILAPAFPALHKHAHSPSEPSCVSTQNVRRGQGQGQGQGQGYTKITISKIIVFTPTCLKLHRYARNTLETSCEGMRVVLAPNIGFSTSISNATQIRPQHFRNFMCVHWECAWCQCQILVLALEYRTLQKYAHSTSESSCVSTGNVRGASAKYWYQHQCCGHYRGIIINYHCNYLSIKALRLPLPLRPSTKVINYHCNYISTIAITITNYRYILGCLQKLLYLTEISYMS